MAEKSFLWTTGVSGDGSAEYTQADASRMVKTWAACHGFEGVAPEYGHELVCADGGANTVEVGTGGAVVDGKPYDNDASVNVTIPSAVGGGNTRIDRVVLRADWSAKTVRITRIAGTDASTPTAPAVTQTPGTTYDIKLCQVLVDTGGAVTVTDEREFAKVGQGSLAVVVPDLAAREGGSAGDWSSPGTTDYTETAIKMQMGARAISISSGAGGVAIGFPETFGDVPMVWCQVMAPSGALTARLMMTLTAVLAGSFQGYIRADDGVSTWDGTATLFWMALGPE